MKNLLAKIGNVRIKDLVPVMLTMLVIGEIALGLYYVDYYVFDEAIIDFVRHVFNLRWSTIDKIESVLAAVLGFELITSVPLTIGFTRNVRKKLAKEEAK